MINKRTADFSALKTRRGECPNKENHTESPSGYGEKFDWFDKMSLTHKQEQCPGCGLFVIWEEKQKCSECGKYLFEFCELIPVDGWLLYWGFLNGCPPSSGYSDDRAIKWEFGPSIMSMSDMLGAGFHVVDNETGEIVPAWKLGSG